MQASGVAAHRRRIGIDLHADLRARLPRGFGEVVGDAVRKHCEIDLLELQGQCAGLRRSHGRDVADEALQRRGVPEHRAQVVVVARMDPVEHRLESPAHDRQGRPQLVRDVGEK